MAQRCGLRPTGGARGELNVDRIVKLQCRHQRRQLCPGFVVGAGDDLGIADATPRRALVQCDHPAQAGDLHRVQLSGRGPDQFRHQFGQHRHVIAGLEGRHQYQRRDLDLVQSKFQFGQSIGRVDVD